MEKVFEHIIQNKDIKFKHAKGMRDIVGKEFHEFHEIFLFISGDAEFISETSRNKLEPNTLIIIPKNTFHYFHVHGEESDYIRLVLNFYETKELQSLMSRALTSIMIITKLSSTLMRDFEYITEKVQNKYSEYEKGLILTSTLTRILLEIKELIPEAKSFESNLSPITELCIKYINDNIHSKITVDDIANNANYSKSSIAHIFKNEMQIPIYTYILNKKLSTAALEIQAGLPSTQVAERYGFNDYSCFYRLYKKKYGINPNAHAKML